MTFDTVMLLVGGVLFVGSVAWMALDVRRRNKAHRDRVKALVEEARRIAREEKEKER